MHRFTELDNPIWHALGSRHQAMACLTSLARRYPREVSPLAALKEPNRSAFAELRTLVDPDDVVALFNTEVIEVPPEWNVMRARFIDQMVCESFDAASATPPTVTLGPSDVPEMLALTSLTEPGPFQSRTLEIGHYLGIRAHDGTLAALAGQRLALDGFTEISAVCTHPNHRGHGYAQALITTLATRIVAAGRVPFLHVKSENDAAKHLYKKLGFRFRRPIFLMVISPA